MDEDDIPVPETVTQTEADDAPLIDQLDAILAGTDEEEPEAEPEASDSPDEPVDEPVDPEVEPGVDYDQLIPQTDGREAMTLGAMKDRLTELERGEESLIQRENAAMVKLDEVNNVLAQVGEIPPQLKALADQKHQDRVKQQHAAMLDALPQMQTREGFERISNDVREVLGSYGASPQEIGNITDHRMIKMAYDLHRLMRQEDTAKATAKQIKSAKPLPTRKRGHISKRSSLDEQVATATKSRDTNVKLAAIDKLIGG